MNALGLHKGIVISTSDPTANNRILVQIPTLTGDSSVWAESCHVYGSIVTPPVGTGVWIGFEGDSLHRPVWLGSFGPSLPPSYG
jgi:hypothetical protein